MPVESVLHRQIERPSGIPGYRSGFWCAVCGRKADPEREPHCTEEGCPNVCHVNCLAGAPVYNCGNTGQLREQAGISDQVTFTTQHPTQVQHPTPQVPLPELTEGEGLGDLSPKELVALVVNLRRELSTSKDLINAYSETIDDLPQKRSVLVDALSIVDTLIALNQSASVPVEQRSIAYTAKPDEIEKD